jgi:ABC-2 type transport system ATP-binding protein
MAAIEIQHLSKRFGPTLAVDDLSFTVAPGAVTGFLGRNGAGKTTTLRAVLGLVAPTSGTATLNGQRYRDLLHPARTVGAVLEAGSFHPGRRARDHLAIIAAASGIPASRVEETLGVVGLADAAGRRVAGFSLGMRQRLGLAAALLGDPEILVLDEPTNGLDPEGIRWLRRFIRDFGGSGRTVLVSSHQLAEVAQTVDQAVIIDHGRHVTTAAVHELTAGLRHGVTVRTPMTMALADALARAGYTANLEGPDTLTVTDATVEAVGRLVAAAGVVVYELRALDADLEEAFFALTRPTPATEEAQR